MRKLALFLILFFIVSLGGQKIKADNDDIKDLNYEATMKQDLLSLMMAYPEYVQGVQKDSSGRVYLLMKSGRKILYDDKREKGFEEKLNNPDLQDMLEQPYPLTPVTKLMDKNFDPGRSRVYGLFYEVYGGSRQQIEKNLTMVNTGYGVYQFNKNNKAAESLRAAFKELAQLAKTDRKISAFLAPCSGTYNYRLISGTGRLSPHSFGTAIDLARDRRDYWKWASPQDGEKRLLSYSKEVVETFEKYNFIWGGKWSHFDILHFEYRPEIILKARYFGGASKDNRNWYDGVINSDNSVKDSIEKINEALK